MSLEYILHPFVSSLRSKVRNYHLQYLNYECASRVASSQLYYDICKWKPAVTTRCFHWLPIVHLVFHLFHLSSCLLPSYFACVPSQWTMILGIQVHIARKDRSERYTWRTFKYSNIIISEYIHLYICKFIQGIV